MELDRKDMIDSLIVNFIPLEINYAPTQMGMTLLWNTQNSLE